LIPASGGRGASPEDFGARSDYKKSSHWRDLTKGFTATCPRTGLSCAPRSSGLLSEVSRALFGFSWGGEIR
jgi:hypothetical protein